MTSKEAFEQTMRGFVFVSGEDSAYKLWKAACEYQKQKDAGICKSLDPKPDEYSPDYEFTEKRKVMECANAILNQS